MTKTQNKIEGQCSAAERRPCVSNAGPPNGGCHMDTPIGISSLSGRRTSVRTAKHKKFNLKSCKVVLKDILSCDNSSDNKLDIAEKLTSQCKIKLPDLYNSPVSDLSVKADDLPGLEEKALNSSNDILSIMKTCGDGKSKGISSCTHSKCLLKRVCS